MFGWFRKKKEKKRVNEEQTDTETSKQETKPTEDTDTNEVPEHSKETDQKTENSTPLAQDLSEDEAETFDPANLYIPRVLYYKSFGSKAGSCPACKSELVNNTAGYLCEITTERGEDVIIMNHDLGWFRQTCPTMVLNPDKLNTLIHSNIREDAGLRGFLPMGLIDVEELPEDSDENPLGGDDNPLPLIPFTDQKTFGRGSKRIMTPGKKRRKKKKKK